MAFQTMSGLLVLPADGRGSGAGSGGCFGGWLGAWREPRLPWARGRAATPWEHPQGWGGVGEKVSIACTPGDFG